MSFNVGKYDGLSKTKKGLSLLPPEAQAVIPAKDGGESKIYDPKLTVDGLVIDKSLTDKVCVVQELPKATVSGAKEAVQSVAEQIKSLADVEQVNDLKKLGEEGLSKLQEAKAAATAAYESTKSAVIGYVKKIDCSFLKKKPPKKEETKAALGGAQPIKEPATTTEKNTYGEARSMFRDKAGNSMTVTSGEGNSKILTVHSTGSYSLMDDSGDRVDKTKKNQMTLIDEGFTLHVGADGITLIEGDNKINIKKNLLTNVERDENHAIGGEHSVKVSQNQMTDVAKNQTTIVGSDRSESVAGNHDDKVSGNVKHVVGGNENVQITGGWTVTVNGNVNITSGGTASVTAQTVNVQGANVSIRGKVRINS